MKEIEAAITGRVQMVMFRDFAQRRARALNLKGTVQNLKDGTVKVIVQGDEETISKYIKLLNQGSILSNVEDVSVSYREPKEEFTDFKIIY